jgi:threonine synthase
MACGVLVPEGKIALGKLSQAIAHGATLLQVDGNFDDCLTLARKLAESFPVDHPETIATAIRIGNPASWDRAIAARDESGGRIEAVTDAQILEAHRFLSAKEGVFVEPGSAASVAGLLASHAAGLVPPGATIVCTVTGHGLKDPQWALRGADGSEVVPTRVPADAFSAARALGLED